MRSVDEYFARVDVSDGHFPLVDVVRPFCGQDFMFQSKMFGDPIVFDESLIVLADFFARGVIFRPARIRSKAEF